jgi:YaaC-like Protein
VTTATPPRSGVPVASGGRTISFSFWPALGAVGAAPVGVLFASDPWALIGAIVKMKCPASARPAALSFLAQAEHYFRTAESASLVAGKPVVLYYAFLNLVKAYILTVGQQAELDNAMHGLKEDKLPFGSREFIDATLTAIPTTGNNLNIFDEFYKAVTARSLAGRSTYNVSHLVAQIVPGHRLWCTAARQRERFIAAEVIEVVQTPSADSVWLRIHVGAEDVAATGLSTPDFLKSTRLDGKWLEVLPDPKRSRSISFEHSAPVSVVTDLATTLVDVVANVRNDLWSTVILPWPYRRYYLYSLDSTEDVLPDLLSLYAVIFYLGSVTRYRPHHFASILESDFGAQVQEVISTVPAQFLYLMASRFAGRDVTRPAII